MKILKIAFTNVNSLRGDHEIDFSAEPFISSSLFAITGPTGSGKSSILDVISLALFNQVPRLGKISRNEIIAKGAILTRNQKEAIARVTYECKNGIFSSQWSISTNRNDNLRDYEMELFDHQKNELIDLKKSDVPNKNEELIGLNYDQFIKAVLLAQGEFAQFLKVTKKERGALLEKITGTGIYRLIGQKVYEKNAELNKDIEQQQNEIKIIKENLVEEEVLKLHHTELQKKTTSCEDFQKEIEKLKKSLALKEDIQKKTLDIKSLEDNHAIATANLASFEKEHGAPLQQHEKVQDYSEELRNWNLLGKEISNLKTEQTTLTDSFKNNSEKTSQLISEVVAFTKTKTDSANFTKNLMEFRNKVLNLKEQKKEKLNDYRLEKTRLEAELNLTEIHLNETNPELTNLEVQEKIRNSEDSLKNWKEEFKVSNTEEIEALKTKLQQEYKTTREATKDYSAIEEIQKELSRNSAENEKLQPQLKSLPGDIEKQQARVKTLQTELEILTLKRENEQLKASLEQQRHKLKDGEPCPLCGALAHPYAEHLPEKDTRLELEIKNIREQLETQTSMLNTYSTNFKNHQKHLGELNENSKTLEGNLQKLKIHFQEKYCSLADAQNLQELEKRCDTLENKVEKLTNFEKEQKELQHLKAALPIIKKLQSILQEGKLFKEKLDELYIGNDIQQDVEQYQNRWISLERDLKNLNESREKLKKLQLEKESSLQILEKELLPKLSEKGFQEISTGFSALMPAPEANRLRLERQQIQKKIDDNQASHKILQNQLEELQNLDSEIKEEEIKAQLQEKNELFQSVSNECKEIDRILKNQEERVTRMQKLQEEIAEKEKQTRRWRMLNELIGDRTGNKFNDFAQDLTLSRLIKLANVRLKDLSDRYLIDKPTEEEDDGLVAIDEHMGGQRRSVKTLSGGETFILSLSMALALSDLASKNVEINSLFIDEGFGTLDPETLDQTLDTLEKLQAESSKTIGVISHVDSLKERIATQIQLTRNGQGYSSLEITG
ncbi:AAA family ATPase [Gramella sp. AN32]|uniref:AAA family ATPase n=1 Tax=Christiangramia antarctica TaxID=2058158 RepID=A0ABW5X3M7_9FLAO|nr:AAA family ATPase [Gramella sp. AN32]MCM4156673.1 hypothetical protein [Gramella sp. AN32]